MRDVFGTEVREDASERTMERVSEVFAESMSLIAEQCKTEPVLFDFFEAIPRVDETLVEVHIRSVSEEDQILDDVVVELLVLLLCAVEQKKRIYKQRQIADYTDVKGAVLIKHSDVYVKVF